MATLAEGRKAVACSRPLDPKSTQSGLATLAKSHGGPCMTRFAETTRPRGACSKTTGDERRRTIQCTPTTPDTHPPCSIPTRSPAFTPSQQSNGIFAHAAQPPAASLHAHARRSSRSPLARPLPCVDRTIGERNLTTPRGLLAQLVELTTHCSDCATAHAHILPPRPGA